MTAARTQTSRVMLTRILDSFPPISGHGHLNCWNERPCVERTTTAVNKDSSQKHNTPQNHHSHLLSMRVLEFWECEVKAPVGIEAPENESENHFRIEVVMRVPHYKL